MYYRTHQSAQKRREFQQPFWDALHALAHAATLHCAHRAGLWVLQLKRLLTSNALASTSFFR